MNNTLAFLLKKQSQEKIKKTSDTPLEWKVKQIQLLVKLRDLEKSKYIESLHEEKSKERKKSSLTRFVFTAAPPLCGY